MIYVTGDTHGMQKKWLQQIEPVLAAGDILIICGDFGVGFWNDRYMSEELFYDWVSKKEYTVLFVDGNHENFNKLINYEIEHWNGGRAHKIRHNIIHLMRGEVYNIEEKTVFTFGGGYSMDAYRREPNVSWWPEQEMPTKEERDYGEENLKKIGNKVDYILTHTAPYESIYYLSTNGNYGIKQIVEEEMPLTCFFDDIREKTEYKHWFFGHLHVDAQIWRNQTAVFSSIRELETGKIVRQWEPYEC